MTDPTDPTDPLVLVMGATGKTGGAVAAQLRSRGVAVRAMVRRRDGRVADLERLGAEIVEADAFDPRAVGEVLRGVQRVYYCPPWHPHMLQSAVVLATAVRRSDVQVVVGLSQWLASSHHPSLATRQNWLADHLFDQLPGVAHATISPGFFADNYLSLIGFASQLGVFPMPLGAGRNAPPSNEDIARVAVAALLDPQRHAGNTYRPTGPALLSGPDMAQILGEVLGRRVRHVEMPRWMFAKALRVMGPRFGLDAFQQTGLRHYLDEHALGAFERGAPTDHVERVAGVPAEDFATIARRYAARPEVKRTVGNFLSAVVDFLRIGVTPALDLDRVVASQAHPPVVGPVLAAESAVWADERDAITHSATG
ncbi:MAG: NmrA family NAD(P)-binding protein [Myxococcota bacterium]